MKKLGALIFASFVYWSAFFIPHVSVVQADSKVLDNGLINLPSLAEPMPYSLYLPRGYCQENLSYPVLYLLHGYGGTHRDWLKAGRVAKTLDRLIESGRISPLIVVMPSASKSWYVNSSKYGQLETALLYELPETLEPDLYSQNRQSGRAIAGLSMGGYGALRFAFRAPERFASVAALSPAIFPNVISKEAFLPVQIKLFAGAFEEPFSIHSYNEKNVFTLAQSVADPPATYLTVGDDDWFGLYAGTFAFYQQLKDRELPVELRVTDGNHNWALWSKEIESALIFLNGKITPAFSRSFTNSQSSENRGSLYCGELRTFR